MTDSRAGLSHSARHGASRDLGQASFSLSHPKNVARSFGSPSVPQCTQLMDEDNSTSPPPPPTSHTCFLCWCTEYDAADVGARPRQPLQRVHHASRIFARGPASSLESTPADLDALISPPPPPPPPPAFFLFFFLLLVLLSLFFNCASYVSSRPDGKTAVHWC